MGIVDSYRDRINQFIHNVFNFYNGKINIFNPAILHIDYGEHMGSANGGTSRNPNIITVFPKVIERYNNNAYSLYYNILVTIIHELYHTDQNISYLRMGRDQSYKNYIESVVEMSTYLYIAGNQKEILENIGLQDTVSYKDYYGIIAPHFETGQLYQRRDYFTHALNLFRELMYAEEHPVLATFVEAFKDMKSIIDIHINNTRFTLKDGIYCMPVAQFNEIMEEEYFKYNLRRAFVEAHIRKDNRYVFVISTSCSNFMGKIVDKNALNSAFYNN